MKCKIRNLGGIPFIFVQYDEDSNDYIGPVQDSNGNIINFSDFTDIVIVNPWKSPRIKGAKYAFVLDSNRTDMVMSYDPALFTSPTQNDYGDGVTSLGFTFSSKTQLMNKLKQVFVNGSSLYDGAISFINDISDYNLSKLYDFITKSSVSIKDADEITKELFNYNYLLNNIVAN